jgi:gliding motility-associatede transport system auxiliary component
MGMKAPRLGQAVEAAGVVFAMVVAVLANVLASRHYARWDLTTHRLYSLSPATRETLRSLGESVEVNVLLSSKDPLADSVRFLLTAYQAETDRLVVRYVDPDRHPADFLAVQQKYGIEAGKTEEGRVMTDAVIVMSRAGGKPFFLSAGELVDEGEDARARSRVEQAFTLTLRHLMSDVRARVCFIVGHGEKRLEDGGPRGLGELAARLRKNNFDPEEVDTSRPDAKDPLSGCRVALMVGPAQPIGADDAARIRTWFEAGGNLFILASPVPDTENRRMLTLGLDAITSPAGITLDETFVFERDPARKLPGGFGEQFLAEPKLHPITDGLVGDRNSDLKILMTAARSLSRAAAASVPPAELLTTSKDAFGMRDFFGWAEKAGPPEKSGADREGPLALSMAAELPKKPAGAAHGPRLVVVGTASVALGQNWQERVLHGGAIFTESAISWLAAEPPLVDIPDKPAVAGARISEASLGEVLRYTVLYIPSAVVLLGLAVYFRRRISETPSREGSGK